MGQCGCGVLCNQLGSRAGVCLLFSQPAISKACDCSISALFAHASSDLKSSLLKRLYQLSICLPGRVVLAVAYLYPSLMCGTGSHHRSHSGFQNASQAPQAGSVYCLASTAIPSSLSKARLTPKLSLCGTDSSNHSISRSSSWPQEQSQSPSNIQQ